MMIPYHHPSNVAREATQALPAPCHRQEKSNPGLQANLQANHLHKTRLLQVQVVQLHWQNLPRRNRLHRPSLSSLMMGVMEEEGVPKKKNDQGWFILLIRWQGKA